jgi:drug/metabolite transporter (DMT)-like permease
MGVVEWLLLLVLAFVWGSAFFFGKLALREVGPLTLVASRLAVAALALNLILLATGQRLPASPAIWRRLAVMGTIGVLVPFTMIFWAQQYINSGLAGILNATVPVWSVILAHYASSDRLTPLRSVGAFAGLAGVAVMLGLEALHGAAANVIPQLAVLVGAMLYAISGFYGRRLRDVPPLAASAGMVTFCALVALPLAAFVEQPWLRELADGSRSAGWPGAQTIGALLALGLLCTAFAYVLYFHMLARVGPANALLSTYLIPVSAVLLGVLVLHERLLPRHLGGVALIAFGLALIDGRLFGKRRVPAAQEMAAAAPTPTPAPPGSQNL